MKMARTSRRFFAPTAERRAPQTPVDEDDFRRLLNHRIRRADRDITVATCPEDADPQPGALVSEECREVRESIRIQALLAEIGAKMGMQIWAAAAPDRGAVLARVGRGRGAARFSIRLPLNYDDTTVEGTSRARSTFFG